MHIDHRVARILLGVALALVALGGVAFLLQGADEPADPSLGPSADEATGAATTTTTTATTPTTPAPDDTAATTPTTAATDTSAPARVPLEGFSEVAVSVDPPGEGGLLEWCLLAARSAEQRSRGLMEVTDLQGYPGMAFMYEEPVDNAFWMRNTPMPLTIAWIGADGQLVSSADMEPCDDRDDCPTYAPGGAYVTAIEVPQGQLDELGIVPGSVVELGGACPPA